MAPAEGSVSGASPRRLWQFVCARLQLRSYLRRPGDGRKRPRVPAKDLLWALLVGQLLRECTFHAVEALVRSRARQGIFVSRRFSDDTLGYFTERLDPDVTRKALASAIKRAKRNKAFDESLLIGLALDGTGAARSTDAGCSLCHPVRDEKGRTFCHLHHFSLISVVGTGLSLPVDVEPYGPGESEYTASQRLLRRAVANLGPRFADYLVGDAEYATAPFVHLASDLGLHVVARLKSNLPDLYNAARLRFDRQPPKLIRQLAEDRVEFWDNDDFDPWESLRWTTVRVLRYRQHKPNGEIVEAYWFTNFSAKRVSTETLYRLAKSRWEIENQGFNDGKNRHGMEHICHHDENSLLITWLVAILALTIERLYRLRYLHRGTHTPMTAIELVRLLRLSLGASRRPDTS